MKANNYKQKRIGNQTWAIWDYGDKDCYVCLVKDESPEQKDLS